MNRRNFLQIAGLTGLSVLGPAGLWSKNVKAEGERYNGPFWVTFHAGGGWDPTLLCDPKGGAINKTFEPGQKGKAGTIEYAPTRWTSNRGEEQVEVFSSQRFFEAHHSRLTVVNGIDTATNNHDTGTRVIWSGSTNDGEPTIAAVAANQGGGAALPMAFLSSGGYDATGGLVPLTRAGSISALKRLAYANRINPDKEEDGLYFSNDTASRIAQAQSARLEAQRQAAYLPNVRAGATSLATARQGNAGLVLLAEQFKTMPEVKLGGKFLEDLEGVGNVNDIENVCRDIQLALTAFQAGVAVSASLDFGGFDTHGDHDNQHIRQMMKLMRCIDFLYKSADALGLSNQLYVVVGSDFGRTPTYNSDNGKDHWNITSMLFSGPGIGGNRVVGGTDEGFKPLKVDPATLAFSGDGGLRIQPKHIHRALRRVAKFEGGTGDTQFPIVAEDLPLFG
ncbi:MAG: DUF1501 domain-containing protein [Myxococcales bacterium]|nr:MAG: DUF1501 domain-containing protein [Myxococcales bacterium]